ncbi:MAG: triose-phosphate isomerase [Thermanaerothrix sp.]|nr:triose-phosphate isomerase [Thermanaerothrix sp.]
MLRPHIVAGNWKMHKGIEEAESFIRGLGRALEEPERNNLLEEDLLEVLIYPTALCIHSCLISRSTEMIKVGAQNGHWEEKGAYTGEISISTLIKEGSDYILIGHSERRNLFGETDDQVAKKVASVETFGGRAMLCVGELLSQRESGETFIVVRSQVEQALRGRSSAFVAQRLAIAYEPVWAIGTGKTASAQDAQEVCSYIREVVRSIMPDAADSVRVLYGGSVKVDNTFDILKERDIDGLLVGGASLDLEGFLGIIDEARRAMASKEVGKSS